MRIAQAFALTLLTLITQQACGACAAMRVGYADQHRPPYYLGSGTQEANPPGASVEVLKEIAASAGCPMTTVRMPPLRLRAALAAGLLESIPLDASDDLVDTFALPVDKNGKLDRERSIHNYTVIYVRAADQLPADLEANTYFRSHKLGTLHGSPFAAKFRSEGFDLDDGATDYQRNFEKLKRGRVDGVAVSVLVLNDLDPLVASLYGSDLVRLEKPVRTSHVWLAFTKAYYAANKEYVDSMWTWVGLHATNRLAALKKKYDASP